MEEIQNLMNVVIKKISGDASFREFYRVKEKNRTSIIVFAKKEKFKNLLTYSAVNSILNNHGILSPKLIKNYYKDNMIEITDLGNKSFYEHIKNKKNKLKYYKKLIELLINVQEIKLKKYYFFKSKKIKFSKYSLSNLHKESDLFFDWYLKLLVKNKNLKKIKKILKNELDNIYKKLYFKNIYFTHRDFHASNVMLTNKKLSIIDSQDAIIGNPMYDVASLIDDVRIKLSKNLQDDLFKYYVNKSKFKIQDQTYLKNDFDILSVQRNLKILGIFVRLYKRDKKPNYLKYLPYTWTLIERRMKNPIFKKLNLLMKKHLSLKKLKKLKKL
jgi:aminoglycoside/choline kinase family phosphotransferase